MAILNSVLSPVLSTPNFDIFNSSKFKWALNFNGANIRGQFAKRLIDPDGDIDIEFYSPSDFKSLYTIVSQNVSSNAGIIEFRLLGFTSTMPVLQLVLGGQVTDILTQAQGLLPSTKYRMTLIGNNLKVYSNGVVLRDYSYARGSQREPNAVTIIGAQTNNVVGSYTRYFTGIMRDIKINGVLYPIDDYTQSIQLPNPTTLGAELIKRNVMENPHTRGSHWTYLGDGRWQYDGDGSLNELLFIANDAQPDQGFLTFEIESITGQITCTNDGLSGSIFNTVGVKRFFYQTKSSSVNLSGSGIVFKRFPFGNVAKCIIKNISFKPLDSCVPLTLSGTLTPNWVQVPDYDVSKFRQSLNFDGVGVRGVMSQRMIDPNGDLDIEFYTPSDVVPTGTTVNKTILSQNITLGTGDFILFVSNTTGNLGLTLCGSTVAIANAGEFGNSEKLRLVVTGNVRSVYRSDGSLLRTGSITRNPSMEPTAQTVIGARTNSSVGNYNNYFIGVQRDIKINGILYPLSDANHTIQLPQPSGLGAELITQSVLENPAMKGTQWSYLGNGRWQYVGDGTLNELRFLSTSSQPDRGFVSFEVESITGTMLCANSIQDNPVNAIFDSVGIKRYFYTVKGGTSNNIFTFKRQFGVASCIIKNISFKPLNGCNPVVFSNTTSANWITIQDDYIAKYRDILNFDGVGIRGVSNQRLINVDGPIDVEWEQNDYDVTGANSQTFISQSISSVPTSREFYIRSDTNESLVLLVGGVSKVTEANVYGNGKWRVVYTGTDWSVFRNGVLIHTGAFVGGTARESAAITSIGTRYDTSAYTNYTKGSIYNLKINGTLWPLSDAGQNIQMPFPTGCGPELLINPNASSDAINWAKDIISTIPLNGNTGVRLTNTSPSYAGAIHQSITTVPGCIYVLRFMFRYRSATTANFRVSINGSNTSSYTGSILAANYIPSTQYMFVPFTATSTTTNVRLLCNSAVNGDFIDLYGISVRQIGVLNSTELVTNGNFNGGTAGWGAQSGGSISVTSGQATLTTIANSASRFERSVVLEAGKYYQVSARCISLSGNAFGRLAVIRNAAGNFATISSQNMVAGQTTSYIFMSPSTDAIVQIHGDFANAGTVVVDDVSIKRFDSICIPITLTNATSANWTEIEI